MVKVKKQKVRFRRRMNLPQRPFMRLRSIAKFLAAVLILGVLGTGFVKLKYMLGESGHFTVKGMQVKLYDEKGFLRDLSLTDIADEEILGSSIFFMDLEKLRENIEDAHPEFKDVVIRRLLPNRLIVNAILRKAIAQIRSDRYYLVDEEGVLLPDVRNFPDPGLPIISGVMANLAKVKTSKFSEFEKDNIGKALGLIKEMNSIGALAGYRVKLVDIADPGNFSFYFEGAGVEIKIGNSDFSNRLKALITVLDQIGDDMDEFRYIDLRFEDPIIGPR